MDDILIIASGTAEKRRKYIQTAIKKGKFFVAECESVSSTSVRMLDLLIYFGEKHRRTGLMDFHVTEKESAINQPLLPTSYHPMNVHRSWPESMAKREYALSSSQKIAKQRRKELIDKWSNEGVLIPCPRGPKKPKNTDKQMRLVLPYHKVLEETPIVNRLTTMLDRIKTIYPGT